LQNQNQRLNERDSDMDSEDSGRSRLSRKQLLEKRQKADEKAKQAAKKKSQTVANLAAKRKLLGKQRHAAPQGGGQGKESIKRAAATSYVEALERNTDPRVTKLEFDAENARHAARLAASRGPRAAEETKAD